VEAVADFIRQFWVVMAGFVGVVTWLVRVDGRTANNTSDIKEAFDEMGKIEARIESRRKEDNDRLARSLSTIEADIKTLLSRGK
jgi:hypothetical protein